MTAPIGWREDPPGLGVNPGIFLYILTFYFQTQFNSQSWVPFIIPFFPLKIVNFGYSCTRLNNDVIIIIYHQWCIVNWQLKGIIDIFTSEDDVQSSGYSVKLVVPQVWWTQVPKFLVFVKFFKDVSLSVLILSSGEAVTRLALLKYMYSNCT